MSEMNWILVVLLIACFLWGTVNKFAIKTFGLYFKKKGYPNPTDDELKECSREVLQSMFK